MDAVVEPTVVPRAEHSVSRRHIDPDALKVLHRLRQFDHLAYLVGGSVRDLLLGRRPKDFDIGTSAHPQQVKRLFRNCWIIGRRFRLAHVKFGPKVVEVATFRRFVPDREAPHALAESAAGKDGEQAPAAHRAQPHAHETHRQAYRENTFGTPEEDAFRRDFTINALFYDAGSFSIIDYVGGLDDLKTRLIRCIGDPDERFIEDPVRMLRAVALAARLEFRVDPPIYEAIARRRAEIARSAPARLLEELYKILRSGASERTIRRLAEVGLLQHIGPELHRHQSDALWRSLAELDGYRAQFEVVPVALTNPVLLGSLLAPVHTFEHRPREAGGGRPYGEVSRIVLGALPIARRDVDRLQQIVGLQRRLVDPSIPYRAQRALMQRNVFAEALTWLEIHGRSPDAAQRWRALAGLGDFERAHSDARPGRRRRRRRRRHRRRIPPN